MNIYKEEGMLIIEYVECNERDYHNLDEIHEKKIDLNLVNIKDTEIISISETWHPKSKENTIDVEYIQNGKTLILDIDGFNNMLEDE